MLDDQIKQRQQHDDEMLRDTYAAFAGVVLGKSVQRELMSEEKLTRHAIEDVLKFYHAVNMEVPDSLTDPKERLDYLCRINGIMYRSVDLQKGWYKDAVGAYLGVRKSDGMTLALLPGKFSGYRYLDPDSRKWISIGPKNEEELEREALCFYAPFPLRKLNVTDLLVFIKNSFSQADIIFTILMTFLVSLVGLITPKATKLLYGDVIDSGNARVLVAIFVLMICTSIGGILIELTKTLVLARVSTKLDVAANAAAIQRLLQMPMAFFRDYSSGELASYLGQISGLCETLFSVIFSTGLTSLFSLIYIIQIFQYARGLVIPAMLVILITAGYTIISAITALGYNKKLMKLTAKSGGLTYELIDGIRKIRLAGAEKRAFAKWGEDYSEMTFLTYNRPIILKIGTTLTTAVSLGGSIAMYFFAGFMEVSISDYAAFTSAYGMVTAAVMSFAGLTTAMASIRPTLETIKPLLDTVPEVTPDKRIVTELEGEVQLMGVSFRYGDNGENVIDDMSLHIRPGEYVAIVGKTGCGKSTLIRLLLGLEKAQKGAIYYDGMDISNLDLMTLRSKIGTVMQNGMLVRGSIRENITITAPGITLDEIWEAAEIAGIAEDIRNMPMGMNTLLSEEDGVSGGQKQRLLIARAVASKPKILIFDEATSALDNITQKKVSQALDAMACTRIVVAHRLSTIRLCDRIVVIDKGHIVEEGSYEELMEQDGFFAELVKRQQ